MIFFRVSFYWDLLQFINSLLLANLNAWSLLGILYPTNSLSCEGHISPVFRANLEIFTKSGQDTMFHFGSTCSEKIINKEINNSYHGLSCSRTSCNGNPAFSQMHHILLSARAVCLRCRLYQPMCSVIFVSRFAHATVLSTTRNKIDQLVWEPSHSYTRPCQGCSTSVGWASLMPDAGFFSLAAMQGG